MKAEFDSEQQMKEILQHMQGCPWRCGLPSYCDEVDGCYKCWGRALKAEVKKGETNETDIR